MCVIAFHWQPDSPTPLLVLANRDEFYARPTAPLAWWEDGDLLAGRDLQAGGTWLGLSRMGRFAALTNHRDPAANRPDAPSRGQLPVTFLRGSGSAWDFLESLQGKAGSYNPFNLLLYDGSELLGFESRPARILTFSPGLHAVSNGAFDEPWPKVEALLAGLGAGPQDDEALLALLADAQPAEDPRLPSTGVSLDWERALSPIFIRTPTYGTRASTLVCLDREEVSLLEQRFGPAGPEGQSTFRFRQGSGVS
jgi:uncharacterized protein with NRDE domain